MHTREGGAFEPASTKRGVERLEGARQITTSITCFRRFDGLRLTSRRKERGRENESDEERTHRPRVAQFRRRSWALAPSRADWGGHADAADIAAILASMRATMVAPTNQAARWRHTRISFSRSFVLALLATSACGKDTVRVPLEIEAPPDTENLTLEVVVTSEGSCGGARPTARGEVFREGDTTPIELARGPVAIWVGAWSGAACGEGLCYAECTTTEVNRDASVRVMLMERPCDEVCGIDDLDGGTDGGADAGDVDAGDLDGGGDGGPRDGGPDGGRDGGTPPACETRGYVEVSVGYDHTCARRHDGAVFCWGVNTSGEAGAPSTSTEVGPTRVILPRPATAIGSGADFSCALVEGRVYCWGDDGADQDRNGDGTANNSNHEVNMPVRDVMNGVDITNVIDLAVGYWHACAALDDGTVRCWGQNASAELGGGDACTMVGSCGQRPGALAPVGVTAATTVAAGLGSSCALLGDATVRCWGYNVSTQLAVEDANEVVTSASTVQSGGSALRGITSLASKGTRTFSGAQLRAHVCGVDADGWVVCWGANDHRQSSTEEGPIVGVSRSFALTDVHEVAPGADHTCAIYGADRRVTCWGRNDDGQLGNGSAGDDVRGPRNRPIVDFTDVCDLSAGERHTCATRADGSVWCWGSNANRRLGDSGAASTTPRRITLPE